jgi:competence protein CoiA
MIWAIKDNQRVQASPNMKGTYCDICNKEVIPKCGQIKVWHFAHKVSNDCDSWSEEETQWHKDWKDKFPKECQEVKVGNHRADIKCNDIIIEFQHSPLSSEQIIERENFYPNMIWVLDGKSLCKGLCLRKKSENSFISFRWKNPPKSWWNAKKTIYVDIEDCSMGVWGAKIKEKLLFKFKKIHPNIPCGGWGILQEKEDFLKWMKK